MKQFILKSEPGKDNVVQLDGDDYRYLVRVRRFTAGDFFNALLPNGAETQVQILSIDRGLLTGKCTATLPLAGEGSPQMPEKTKQLPPIVLFQALPKGEKMDLIVRQAAEGGITEVVPFVSEFSVVKIKSSAGAEGQKFSRWERIIKEARQQSGSAIATSIRRPLTTDELFEYWNKLGKDCLTAGGGRALGVIFHHQDLNFTCSCQGLAQASLHSYLDIVPSIVALAIGPEGGFSSTEVSRFLESGFQPLTVGDTILRTETAALYAAAAVRVLLLERNSWELKQPKTGSV